MMDQLPRNPDQNSSQAIKMSTLHSNANKNQDKNSWLPEVNRTDVHSTVELTVVISYSRPVSRLILPKCCQCLLLVECSGTIYVLHV